MTNEDFFSFDEALSELRLKEEELKRLVSEGEIRAFREGDTMKLRRGDVEALRSELGGEVVRTIVKLTYHIVGDFNAGIPRIGNPVQQVGHPSPPPVAEHLPRVGLAGNADPAHTPPPSSDGRSFLPSSPLR